MLKKIHSIEILRGSLKLLSSQTLIIFFSIFYFVIITRVFSKIELSSVAVFSIITSFCAMFTGLGLTTSCLKLVPELISKNKRSQACSLIKISLKIPIILSILSAVIVFLFSDSLSQVFFKSIDYGYLIKIVALGVVTYKIQEILTHIFKSVQRFGKMAITKAINEIGGRILALSLFFYYGIKGYIFGLVLGQALVILLSIYYLKDYIFAKSEFYSIKSFIRFSLPYYWNGFVRYGLMQMDHLIIGVFLAPEILATYYVARKFLDYMVIYVDTMLSPVTPKISELKALGTERVQNAFAKTSRYLSFSLVPPCFLLASISYPLMQIYGGGKYIAAIPIIAIMSIAAIFYCVYSLYSIYLYIIGKPIERFKQETFGGFLNVLFSIILIFPLNILGIAFARLFSFIGGLFFSRHLLHKLIKMKFDIKSLRNMIIYSIVMSSIIIVLQLIHYNIFLVPAYVLAGIIIFLFLFIRSLNPEDFKLLQVSLPEGYFDILKNLLFCFLSNNTKNEILSKL